MLMITGTSTRTEICQIPSKGYTKFTLLKETSPKGIFVVWRETDKCSVDDQTRQCVARSMDQNCESRSEMRKNDGSNEKPKLDNSRRMRDIYFTDHEDEEYKHIMKNAKRKLEVHRDAAVPCKKRTQSSSDSQETGARLDASNEVPKTKYACIVEAHESMRQRVEPSIRKKTHEYHIAGKG